MRIEAYNQIQPLYPTQNTRKAQTTTSTARTTDRVQISSMGKDYQTAKAAIEGTPDIREELTAPIKAKIQDGTYSVDNDTFADKLLKKIEEMR